MIMGRDFLSRLLLAMCLLLPVSAATAQEHLSPPNGGKGVPGPVARSFVIEWEEVPGAVAYEYVLSDNPSCFSGCPGDTREDFVHGTSAIEFNLREGTWYYWITRVRYSETEVSHWSNITSFLAETPESAGQIARIAPNPATNPIGIHVDWGISPAAEFIHFELYDLTGRRLISPTRLDRSSPRLEVFQVSTGAVAAGVYLAVFLIDGNPNNPNNRVAQTVVLL